MALARILARFRPPPSSLDLDDDAAGFVEGVEEQGPGVRLAPGPAHVQGLDAVVDGVADDVHQRVAELLHDGLVQLRVGAVDLQLDGLAQLLGDVPHDAPEAVEGLADLHHAQAQGLVPDLLHQLVDDGGGLQQAAPVGLAARALARGPGDHQLAHQVHQPVQLVRLDLHHLHLLGLAVLEASSACPGPPPTTGGGTACSSMRMVPEHPALDGAVL